MSSKHVDLKKLEQRKETGSGKSGFLQALKQSRQWCRGSENNYLTFRDRSRGA